MANVMEPIELTFDLQAIQNEMELVVNRDFVLWAESGTKFRFPPNSTRAVTIHFRICNGKPIQSKQESTLCHVPLEKTTHSKSTTPLHRNFIFPFREELYLCANGNPNKWIPATARNNTFVSSNNFIFFRQQKGVEDKFAPDMTGYIINTRFLTNGLFRWYYWKTKQVISEKDYQKLIAEYNRLKATYKEIPPKICGKIVIPECYWQDWQLPDGYTRMTRYNFKKLPVVQFFGFATKYRLLFELGVKSYYCMDLYFSKHKSVHYIQLPKEWETFVGFLTDPKVIDILPNVRELLVELANPDSYSKIHKALCALV